MSRPLALDLFCGAGGAAMGIYRAGFDVVGVDIKRQKNYPFPFIQADALKPPFDLSKFDFIWASPPCQAYSIASQGRRVAGKVYPELIPKTRKLLNSFCGKWVMENVKGAPLSNATELCGVMFGLGVFRHRLFESNIFLLAPAHTSHGGKIGDGFYFSVAGGGGRWKSWGTVKRNVNKGTAKQWANALGIDWMTRQEMTQSIPPAYSEFLCRQVIKLL